MINNTTNGFVPPGAGKHLVLGVIGHVDHGKTALVRALSGEDTDRLQEEKRRGISIALGFARMKMGNTEIDLIDMPGHERFVRTMISGATGIDAVLLVVAANEGIQPQTIEHVDIAALLGLARAVVAVAKADLVDPMQAGQVADDAMRLLVRSGLEPMPPVFTSALHGTGIQELKGRLEDLAAGQLARAADGVAFLPIDRAFSIAGHGPVVTGTLRGAAVAVGDTLELLPPRRTVRVRAVQVHGERVVSAGPGQRVALNLRDVEIAELGRGMALAAPDALPLSNWLTMSIRALPGAQPLTNGMRLRALLGTDERGVRLRLLDRNVLEAGHSAFAQLHSLEPFALPAREPVVLRVPSPPRTVAGGRVLEPGARRAQRLNSRILQRLEDLSALPPAAIMVAEVERAGTAGTTLRSLAQLLALPAPRILELLRTLPLTATRSGAVLRKSDVDSLLMRIPVLLTRHAALSRDALLEASATGGEVLDEALRVLLARGAAVKRGSEFLIPRPQQEQARARDEADLAGRIAEVLRRGGLSPPTPGTFVTDARSNRAVERLLREGVIVRAVDLPKGKEMLFHREAIADAQRRLAPLLERAPGLLVTEIGALLGISRKFTLPLLNHLDTIRFTRRVKDRRVRA